LYYNYNRRKLASGKVRRVEKLEKEVEERFDENNILKGKITQDHCLSLWLSKRLERYPLCEEEF